MTHYRKSLNLIFAKLSSQNMHGFGHATPGTMTPLLCYKYGEKQVAEWKSRCLPKGDLLLLALHVAILLIGASIFHTVVGPQISGKSAKSCKIHKNTQNTKIW